MIRRWRDLLVRPFAALITALRIPAGAVSCAGVLFAATAFWTFAQSPRLSLVSVLAPLLCDALDGAVARQAGTACAQGKLLDHLCDASVFAVLLAAAAAHGLASAGASVYAAHISLLVVVFGLTHRAAAEGTTWNDNPQAGFGAHFPKSFFLAALITLLLGGPDWIRPALIVSNVAATLIALILFARLSRQWPLSNSGDSS